jgi:uncharacterized protein
MSPPASRSHQRPVPRSLRCLPVLIVIAWLSGCHSASAPAELPTCSMTLGSRSFVIEIANTDPTREKGLMQRDSMPADHGMIFVFPDEKPRDFWMKNTRFDLDIAFLDASGKVVSIKQMKAYDLSTTPSDAPAKYAVELNKGAAANAGLKVSDQVQIPPQARDARE